MCVRREEPRRRPRGGRVITEIEIVRDLAGGKAYPWSIRKVGATAPGGGPADPWQTAADAEQAIRLLRPQLTLVPDGVEVVVTVHPAPRAPAVPWKVTEKIYSPPKGTPRETITFVEAASKAEAVEMVYARVASEQKTPTSFSRIFGSVHTRAAYYTIEKPHTWDLPSSWTGSSTG